MYSGSAYDVDYRNPKLSSISLNVSYGPIPVSIMPLQIWFTHNCVLNGLGYGIGHRFKSFVITESIV